MIHTTYDRLDDGDPVECSSKLNDVIKTLVHLHKRVPDEFKDTAMISVIESDDNTFEFYVLWERPLTPEEISARMESDKYWDKVRMEELRLELSRLEEKYGT